MYRLIVPDTTAIQIAPWFQDGGIRVWSSLDLGRPEQQWLTPIDADKPHYAADNTPEEITDSADVGVVVLEEVERFFVHLRVSGNGLSMKLTDDANQYLNERLVIAGRTKYASYVFDYDTQEAVILDTTAEPWGLDIFVDVGDAIGLPVGEDEV